MKILLVTNMYPTKDRPGYGIFVKEQMDAVRTRFTDVDYDVYYINKRDASMAYLKSIFEINRLIDSGKYDAVHVHYGLSGLFILFRWLKRKHIPVVITLHGGDIQPEQGKYIQVFLTRRILRHADVVISLNDRMTQLASRYCASVVKIPCSVDTRLFVPPVLRIPLAHKKKLIVVFPSDRSRTVKNYPLFQAVTEAYAMKYSTVIESCELKDMSRTDIVKTLQRADMMLMTSISEGSPQVVKEAMACDLPVVSTDVGDIETLLSGVRSSLWSALPEVDSLVDCMRSVVEGKVDGIAPRDRIMQLGYDHESVSRRVYDIYNTLGL